MPELLETDAEQMAPISGDIIKIALERIQARQAALDLYYRYYDGQHPFNFASEKFTTEYARRLQAFRDNLCPTIVKAPADRLEVIGFAADQSSKIYETSWRVWQHSSMPRFSKRVHRDAFKTGDAFVVVWLDDEGRARIIRQDPRQCAVFYNFETNKIELGAKAWIGTDKRVYVTLYFPDRIEKYISKSTQSGGTIPVKGGAYERRRPAGEKWPVINELGVCPMFHFGLEKSILHDVIPLNDALNKSIADLLVSSESNSLQQRWAAGIAFEINPETGEQIIPWDNAAKWVATADASAKFGEFGKTGLKDYLETINDFRHEIASVSGIPHYYFRLTGGALPSGEALRKAESRFIAIISDAQLDFGEVWGDVMKFAMTLDPKEKVPAKAEIETRWKPADPLSANEAADLAIKKKTIGVSPEKLQSELGYSSEEIEAMAKENATRAKANADTFQKVFDAGPSIDGE